MGEVYRATDTRLKRDIALKILPEAFARDPERMARFQREAEVLASLNHPNIAAIYGLEENALVMELVEGESPHGPMAFEDAWKIAIQVAAGLEYAHERRIVHRDLKPANLRVTPDGRVKILDFGLAKALAGETSAAVSQGTNSPTLTMGATQVGMIMGTAAYMAPEQVRGKEADRRADIWAFGVVLYELLTGEQMFQGSDAAEIMAHVLTQEPDFSQAPAKVRRLLGECLRKDPDRRLRWIGDVARFVDAEATAPLSAPRAWAGAAVAGVLAVLLAALAFVHFREEPPESRVVRTFIPPPEKARFTITTTLGFSAAPVLSPDGRRLVFGATSAEGKIQLWLRPVDSLTAQPLAGTERGSGPFWSPDSRYVAFFAGGKLKKIDTFGGPPVTLCDAPQGRGGAWNQAGVIVFAPSNTGPLYQVSAEGGISTPVTKADTGISHRFPWFLPDGRHFLYAAYGIDVRLRMAAVRVSSIDSIAEGKVVVDTNSNAIYAQGYLLFLREDTLMAQPFDVKRLVTTGEAIPVAESVQSVGNPGRSGVFSASGTGLLAYLTGGSQTSSRLVWFDRGGKQIETLGDPGNLSSLHLSPDGRNAAVSIADVAARNQNIWLFDVGRRLRTRFTFDSVGEFEAVWSPDGSSIAFDSNEKGPSDLYRKASSGAGAEELLYADKLNKFPRSWSPDGKFLLYRAVGDPKTGDDLWVLPLAGERKPFPFAQTTFAEVSGQFSPDGRWIAYQSDESQRAEIYVAPFNGPGSVPAGKRQISTAGGIQPRWRRDGKEIFYISSDGRLTAADVSVKGTTFEVGAVRALFPLPIIGVAHRYDVSPDGQRFLAIVPNEQPDNEPVTLVQNWTAGLKK